MSQKILAVDNIEVDVVKKEVTKYKHFVRASHYFDFDLTFSTGDEDKYVTAKVRLNMEQAAILSESLDKKLRNLM